MSNPTRVDLEPAYVLHGRAYRETSQIVEVFTAGHGRLGLVAKGSRRPKSALRGMLNPFQPLRLSWSGRGELPTLTQAELGGTAIPLTGSAVMAGFYVNELLMKLLERVDPHPDLFAHYASLIAELGEDSSIEALLRRFELQLLNEIGYAPELSREAETHAPLDAGKLYEFRPESGVMPATGRQSGDHYTGELLLSIDRLEFESAEVLRAAKRLLRNVLNFHLGDRGLQTRRVASAMKRQA